MTQKTYSARHKNVYAYVVAHITQHGFAPTLRQIGAACGIRSVSVVLDHVNGLAAEGKLVRGAFHAARALTLPNTRRTPVEKRAQAWLQRGAVVVGYQRKDGTLAGFEAWQNRDGVYVRIEAVEANNDTHR